MAEVAYSEARPAPELQTLDLDKMARDLEMDRNPAAAAAGVAESAARLETAEAITAILHISFELIAARKGAHWKMSLDEATEAGKAYGAVIDKYYPDTMIGVEVTAITVTAMVLIPRMAIDRQLAAQSAAAENAADLGEGESDNARAA